MLFLTKVSGSCEFQFLLFDAFLRNKNTFRTWSILPCLEKDTDDLGLARAESFSGQPTNHITPPGTW